MSLDDIPLSEYGRKSSVPSPVNRMMAAFAADFRQGIDINLGVGYVNEDTIPKQCCAAALDEILEQPNEHRAAFNYGGPDGSANLIDAVKRYLVRRHLVAADVLERNRLIIGVSGATSLLESAATVVAPGIVVTGDPMYYIYCNFLERHGFRVLTVAEDREGISVDALRGKLETLGSDADRIRFVYAVTVNNPTCTILSNARRLALLQEVNRLSRRLQRKVPLILDCAYEALIHDPDVEPPRSALPSDELGLVYEIGSLSKILAPALRVGTMIGPDSDFFRAMVQRTSDVGFSAPMLTQEIAAVLLNRHADEQVRRVTRGYREKALRVRAWLAEYLGDVMETCTGGRAGFYFYITLKCVETHESSAFFQFLARTTGDPVIDGPAGQKKTRVVYIPGEHCVHPAGDMAALGRRQLRLSYGFEELAGIERALALMRDAAAYATARQAAVT